MKQKAMRAVSAFTRIELIVVIVVVLVLALNAFAAARRVHASAQSYLKCLDSLKEIGTAYRLWAGDNGNRNPAAQAIAKRRMGRFSHQC